MQSSFTPVLETEDGRGPWGTHVLLLPEGSHGDTCAALHTRVHTHSRVLSHGDAHGPGAQEYDNNLFSGIRGIYSHTTSLGAQSQEVCAREPVGTAGMGRAACSSSVHHLFVWVPCVKTNSPSSTGDDPRAISLVLGDHIKEASLNIFRVNGASQRSKGPAHFRAPEFSPTSFRAQTPAIRVFIRTRLVRQDKQGLVPASQRDAQANPGVIMDRGSCLKGGDGGGGGPPCDAVGWHLLRSDLGHGQRGREWSPQTPRTSDLPIRDSGAAEAQHGPHGAPWHFSWQRDVWEEPGLAGPQSPAWTMALGAVV